MVSVTFTSTFFLMYSYGTEYSIHFLVLVLRPLLRYFLNMERSMAAHSKTESRLIWSQIIHICPYKNMHLSKYRLFEVLRIHLDSPLETSTSIQPSFKKTPELAFTRTSAPSSKTLFFVLQFFLYYLNHILHKLFTQFIRCCLNHNSNYRFRSTFP